MMMELQQTNRSSLRDVGQFTHGCDSRMRPLLDLGRHRGRPLHQD